MNSDFFIDLGFSVLFTLLRSPKAQRDKFKKALIKLRDTLNMAYPPEM